MTGFHNVLFQTDSINFLNLYVSLWRSIWDNIANEKGNLICSWGVNIIHDAKLKQTRYD